MTYRPGLRPYRIDIPDADLADLHERLDRTRWPIDLDGISWERGIPTTYLKPLAAAWRNHNWRFVEARLNEIPQYETTIEGQPIHLFGVESPEPDALPLLLTHGWPSSSVEFLQVIGPLSDPRAHGGDPADAFHLVIPSLPGYGFSNPTHQPGWGNLFRVAQAWTQLMDDLGYERYGAHGTDVGSGVTQILAMLDPTRVVGAHLTGTSAAMPFGPPVDLDGLSTEDRARAARFNAAQSDAYGYLHLQATRPQTLGYALSDSPVAQLAWIAEKFKEWTDPAAELPEDAVDLGQLLATVSIFWFTRSGAAASHGTYDGMKAWRAMVADAASGGAGEHAAAPTGVAVFAADTTIRTVFDPSGQVEHWRNYDRGGHFPAMEVPDLLTSDIRDFFRGLR